MTKNNSQIAVQLTNISKRYEIHHEKPTLVEKFIKGKNEKFWALKNINLTINRGERVGIVGPTDQEKPPFSKSSAGLPHQHQGRSKHPEKLFR